MKGKVANPNTVNNMTLVNAKSQSKAASLVQKIGKGKRKAKVELSKGNMKYLGKLVKEMKKQMLPYEKKTANVFTFLNYLEKEAQSKSKKITLMLSFEELDLLKMQVKESTKAIEDLRLNLKWYNLFKKFMYGLLVKQNKYFLEELTK